MHIVREVMAVGRGQDLKVGLALGSGSARGWAHIGVIKALAEAGVRVDFVAGTSIGALVGAIYASGNIDDLRDAAVRLDCRQIARFLDIGFPKAGLIDGKKIADHIRSHVQDRNMEDLSVPFRAVATDLTTGREVVLQDGDVVEAVRSSISVPGVFAPVRKGSMILVDGGLVNPVPVSSVRDMGADFVIAVDLNHDIVANNGVNRTHTPGSGRLAHHGTAARPRPAKGNKLLEVLNDRVEMLDLCALSTISQWIARRRLSNILDVLTTSIHVAEMQITSMKLRADPPDLLLRPNLGHIGFLEFNRAKEAIAEGYREARARLGSLIQGEAGPAIRRAGNIQPACLGKTRRRAPVLQAHANQWVQRQGTEGHGVDSRRGLP